MKNQSGLSLIATILTLLIFSLFIAVAVSLVTTGAHIGVMELQGQQAFDIADGGLQYAIRTNGFPNFGVSPAVTLGKGSFAVSVPTLSANIGAGNPINITVSSTDGFTTTNNPLDATPNQYWIMMCDTAGNATPNVTASSTCEKISFTGETAISFTGGTRGRDSSNAAAHLATAVVLMYSWDATKTATIVSRTFAKGDNCSTAAKTICVTSTANFASSGLIRINDGTENNIEDVFYDGIGGVGACGPGCSACLGSNIADECTRMAYNVTGSGTVDHPAGTQIWQSEITALPTSIGVIPGSVLTGNIQRVVRDKVMRLQ